MVVKSQDRRKIVFIEGIDCMFIREKPSTKTYFTVNYKEFELAKFETQEKAESILEEIINAYTYGSKTYRIPKEEKCRNIGV